MLILGIALLIFILGLVMFRFPPKKRNSFYGYRMPRACKTQENWDFAQKYAGIQMAKSGVVLIFIALALWLFEIIDTPVGGLGFCGCLIVGVIYPVFATEKALKQFENADDERLDP